MSIKTFKMKIILFIILILFLFNFTLYTFNKVATPILLTIADAEIRAKSIEILNKAIITQYSNQFKYDEVINIEKDNSGNIAMLKADTLKMNKIACDVAIDAQNQLKALGEIGIKIPLGNVFENNLLSDFGPNITIKMKPIGYVETNYSSDFESAGINQTRHKIYVNVKTSVRVILPLNTDDIEIKNEIPIAETILVGKIPNSAINLDLKDAGFKIK